MNNEISDLSRQIILKKPGENMEKNTFRYFFFL